MRSDLNSERGAILVQVAIATVTLLALNAFVVDYGVMWAGRGQAQNAADAGALAAATSLAFDNFDDRTDTGPAKVAGHQFAVDNWIWGQAPDNDIATDVTFPTTPSVCADNSCVRVDVYRNQERGNPLPAFFGAAAGITGSGVKAMAIARAAAANATDCLKPWAVVDKWIENYPAPGPWTTSSAYDKYYTQGPNAGTPDPAINPADQYVPPSSNDPGSGFHPFNADGTYTSDYGLELTLKLGSGGDFKYGSGWFMNLDFGTGGKTVEDEIKGCVGVTFAIGDMVPTETGGKVGPNVQGAVRDADSLYNQDPGAYWDSTMNGGHGGVAGSAYAISPRIVPVPLVSADEIAEVNKGGKSSVTIMNIMGFFVEGLGSDNKSILGRIVMMPGLLSTGSTLSSANSFLRTVLLVR